MEQHTEYRAEWKEGRTARRPRTIRALWRRTAGKVLTSGKCAPPSIDDPEPGVAGLTQVDELAIVLEQLNAPVAGNEARDAQRDIGTVTLEVDTSRGAGLGLGQEQAIGSRGVIAVHVLSFPASNPQRTEKGP
jgi:hypothetical protein